MAAANPLKGEVSLEVTEGETYTLKFGWNALALAERQHRAPFAQIVNELDAGYSGAVVTILWAALQAHHPRIDYDAAGAITLRAGTDTLRDTVIEVIGLGFPKREEGGAKARPQKAAAA